MHYLCFNISFGHIFSNSEQFKTLFSLVANHDPESMCQGHIWPKVNLVPHRQCYSRKNNN